MSWFRKEKEEDYILIYDDGFGYNPFSTSRLYINKESVAEYISSLKSEINSKDSKIEELEYDILNNTRHKLIVQQLEDKIEYLESRLKSILEYKEQE